MVRIPPDDFLGEFVAVRVAALRSVLYPDAAYHWRKICRWAVSELNISIFEAQAMPLDELLQHYHEARLESLDQEELDKITARVLETPEERVAREDEEVQDDEELDELVEQLRRQNEENKKAKAATHLRPGSVTKDIPDLSKLPPDVSVMFEDSDDPEITDWSAVLTPQGNL